MFKVMKVKQYGAAPVQIGNDYYNESDAQGKVDELNANRPHDGNPYPYYYVQGEQYV